MNLFADVTDVCADDVFPICTQDKALALWIKQLADVSLELVLTEKEEMYILSIPDDASAASFARKIKELVKTTRHKYICSQISVMLQVLGVSLKLASTLIKKIDLVPEIEISREFHETIILENPSNKNKFIIEMELYVDQICVDSAFEDVDQSDAFTQALDMYNLLYVNAS